MSTQPGELHVLALVLSALAVPGCVTETIVRPAPPVRTLPAGPVASPALDARSLTTHVRVEITPLGSIAYDGQVLPRVSPDGLRIAVQGGRAPAWDALTGAPGATVPIETRLTIYDISGSTPVRIEPAAPLPPGLMLGRDCDERGFLVEWARPDESRWIGRMSWETGELTWLVQGEKVTAHAVFNPGGGLLYASREVEDDQFAVVAGDDTIALDDASLEYPWASGEPGLIFALERTENGLFVVAIEDGAVTSRWRISASHDPIAAYQGALPASISRTGEPKLTVFLPGERRMGVFDPGSGSVALLPDGSIAAARYSATGGYFCTTPGGLVYVPRAGHDDFARVFADPFVPLATMNLDRPFVLFGPDLAGGDRLRVFALKPRPVE